jgi:hypothetical protein
LDEIGTGGAVSREIVRSAPQPLRAARKSHNASLQKIPGPRLLSFLKFGQ